MNLEISSFADAGNFEKERLVIKIVNDTDIGEYAVFQSRLSSQRNPTWGTKRAYWFPDGAVKSGDLVVLYTKRGKNSTKSLASGRTAHFYYWGQENALWGSPDTAAVVLEISDWISESPSA